MFASTLKTSLLMANCSKFLLRRRRTLSRWSRRAVSVVQPAPKSMTSGLAWPHWASFLWSICTCFHAIRV